MTTAREGLVDRLKDYDRLVEIGVGQRPDVARKLTERGCEVTATDVVEREIPDRVSFVIDDVTDPDPLVYSKCECVYALNLPPELHRPAWETARDCGADFLFTTLGGDQPQVPVDREMLPEGETLYVAPDDAPGVRRD